MTNVPGIHQGPPAAASFQRAPCHDGEHLRDALVAKLLAQLLPCQIFSLGLPLSCPHSPKSSMGSPFLAGLGLFLLLLPWA